VRSLYALSFAFIHRRALVTDIPWHDRDGREDWTWGDEELRSGHTGGGLSRQSKVGRRGMRITASIAKVPIAITCGTIE
jgi:hypothetical protein